MYKCRIKTTGQFVALKLVTVYGKTAAELDQLEKEIGLLRDMESPFVTKIFEDFKEAGHWCIAMELAQSDLYDIIKYCNYKTMQADAVQLDRFVRQLQKISVQVLSGLSYLHKNGIAHRDIKPQNVLLVKGTCKLCDFGFAKQV